MRISEMVNISTGISIGGSGGIDWGVVSYNTNAVVGNGYIVDTIGGEVTLTFPISPVAGDQIGVSDYNGNFETNKCTISRNGQNIMGLSENFICDINNTSIMFVYADVSQGWKILYGI